MLRHALAGRSIGRLALIALAAAATGCGRVDFTPGDAGVAMDAGEARDAGLDAAADAGVAPFDAPMTRDAGRDAGADAGASGDAGVDAEAPDAAAPEPVCPAAACSSGCSLDERTGSWSCTGSAVTLVAPGPGALVDIDMTGHARLDLTVVTCSPSGFVWHLADSPTCNGYGGDGGNFGHDAEVYQLDTTLEAYASQDVAPGVRTFSNPAFATAGGCTLSTVSVYDGRIVAPSIALDATDPGLLVIDPPTDSEGPPDARWYLATDRTYGDASRSGTGFRCMTLCIP